MSATEKGEAAQAATTPLLPFQAGGEGASGSASQSLAVLATQKSAEDNNRESHFSIVYVEHSKQLSEEALGIRFAAFGPLRRIDYDQGQRLKDALSKINSKNPNVSHDPEDAENTRHETSAKTEDEDDKKQQQQQGQGQGGEESERRVKEGDDEVEGIADGFEEGRGRGEGNRRRRRKEGETEESNGSSPSSSSSSSSSSEAETFNLDGNKTISFVHYVKVSDAATAVDAMGRSSAKNRGPLMRSDGFGLELGEDLQGHQNGGLGQEIDPDSDSDIISLVDIVRPDRLGPYSIRYTDEPEDRPPRSRLFVVCPKVCFSLSLSPSSLSLSAFCFVTKKEREEKERSDSWFDLETRKKMTEPQLEEAFRTAHDKDLEYCKIITDRQTNQSKGFAYVKFFTAASAARAMEEIVNQGGIGLSPPFLHSFIHAFVHLFVWLVCDGWLT